MVLTDEDIKSFQKLYKEQYGSDISKEDAYEQGIKLLRMMSLVYKPMTEKEFTFIQERRNNTAL